MNKQTSITEPEKLDELDELAKQLIRDPDDQAREELFQNMCATWPSAEIAAAFYRTTQENDKCDVLAQLDLPSPVPEREEMHTVASYYFKAGASGADKVACELADLFASMGYRSILLCDEEVGDNLVSPDVECIVLPPFQQSNPGNYRKRAWALQDALESYGVDAFVYHQWLSHVLPWDMMIAKLMGVRFIVHTHGSCIALPRYRVEDFYTLPLAYRQASAVACLSELDCAFWSLSNPHVYRTFNMARYSTAETARSQLDGKTILWIGHLHPIEKRPDEAIEVMAELHALVPDAKLKIVGSGTAMYEQQLKELAVERGVASCIEFCGHQPDPRPYFEQASALLITSQFEGYPLGLAESKVYGLPCVLYDLPNIVFQEVPRGTVPVRQLDRHAAATELARILNDAEYRESLGKASRAQAEDLESFDRTAFWKGVIENTAIPYVMKDARKAQNRLWNLFWRESCDAMRGANERITEFGAHAAVQDMRIRALERRIAEIESSAPMRVGRVATALPRMIKNRMNRE